MHKLLIGKVMLALGVMLSVNLSAQDGDTQIAGDDRVHAESAQAPVLGNALNQLQTFTDGLDSFSADFTQSAYDPQGRLEETSSGILRLSKPNLLHWKYTEPFPQLIVADGQRVWSYDIELEQITVREQSDAQAQSPLTLLTDPEKLYKSFTLRNLGAENGLSWLEMLPRDDAANESGISSNDFARILIGMQSGQLRVMALEDTLGQSTRIEFVDGARNIAVEPQWFNFVPPDGVDVLEG